MAVNTDAPKYTDTNTTPKFESVLRPLGRLNATTDLAERAATQNRWTVQIKISKGKYNFPDQYGT